jgi:uncharacterized protein (TIGR03067 family)
MRLICLCLLVGHLAAFGLAAEPDPAKKDLDALQGEWNIAALEYNGQDLTGKYKIVFVFKGDVATVEGDGAVRKEYAKITFKLDPSTNPKCVDLTIGDGVQKGAAMEGIYELKGDELRLCVKVLGKERPGEFKSPDGASVALLTLKRQK